MGDALTLVKLHFLGFIDSYKEKEKLYYIKT